MTAPPIVILKCRICLGESDETSMHALFDSTTGPSEETDTEDATISENSGHREDLESQQFGKKIEFCCGVKIRRSPGMPSTICHRCHEFVRMWYHFRQMCLNSQVYLESSCLDAEKPDELIDASDSEYMEYLYESLQNSPAPIVYVHPNSTSYPIAPEEEEFIVESDYAADEDGNVGAEEEQGYIDVEQSIKHKQEEIFVATLEPFECNDEISVPNYINESQLPDNDHDDNNYGDNDDFLSPTPSPEPPPSAPSGKRRPGRPRKPDSELKSKRKVSRTQSSKFDMQSEDLQTYKFICNLCGNVYQKKAAYTSHMTAHSDYKPHQCEICLKSFRQMGELRAHIRRHTGERPYKCLYCERHFYDRSEKVRHERVHTNTRPYACKECGKTFTHTAILKNHSLVHSGKKNYNCTVCSKSFTLQHQLKAHLQTITHKAREEQGLASTSS